MQRKVQSYMIEQKMFEDGDHVIAAVSGGADSVCLLSLLVALREEWNLNIRVVHVHHGLRGAEADRDAAYVEELSDRLGVPCLVVHCDIRAFAKAQGVSVEEAGRMLRYRILQEQADAFGKAKIAVAHHRADQAETILHHLFRGSGLRGLGGMQAVRDRIVRPLLCCGREEILDYLKTHQIAHCEDSTNASEDYTRNKLRNSIIPLIETQINSAAVEHVLHMGEMAAQADAYFVAEAHKILAESELIEAGRSGIALEVLRGQADIMRTYLVREMLFRISGSGRDITARHIRQIASLPEKEVGAEVDLPNARKARRTYEHLWIEDGARIHFLDDIGEEALPNVVYTCFSYEKHQEIPQNQYTKWFDYDRIMNALSLRTRRMGDYMTLKDGKHKTIKSYMIDEKIPKEQRDRIPVLADGNHVLWIIGYRMSEYYKITDATKQVLQVQTDGGKNHGR
ncbi:MAG: tRNA lysidine(34) synthetase TilS [Hungatella sp.]